MRASEIGRVQVLQRILDECTVPSFASPLPAHGQSHAEQQDDE